MASLTTLPTELLLEIYYRLYPLDKHNLILTSRYFRNHLGSLVLTREETVEELKRFEHVSSASSAQSQILLARCPRLTPQAYRIPHKYCQLHAVSISLGTPYKRVCETCLRLRQFFHFSHPQAGKRTGKRTKRCCIDCQEECARVCIRTEMSFWIGLKVEVRRQLPPVLTNDRGQNLASSALIGSLGSMEHSESVSNASVRYGAM